MHFTPSPVLLRALIIALFAVVTGFLPIKPKTRQGSAQTSSNTAGTNSRPDTITISAVGDLMVGSNFPCDTLLPKVSEGNILQYAMPLLSATDIRIGNLESAISDSARLHKDCSGAQCYAFRTPYKTAGMYTHAGFNYLNLANNHSFDFGVTGVRNTLEFLLAHNIRCGGVLQRPYDTLRVRNTMIGFASFAPHTNSLDMNNDSLVSAVISELRSRCDVLIVFFHGGAEGATHQHITGAPEIFLGQNRGDVKHFAHLCVDQGADLVIGSGPHVVRAAELYKNKFIAYSLGNFATYHQFNLKFPNNVAPLLQLSITDKGALTSCKVYSFLQHGEGIPKPDKAQQAYKLIRTLSLEDFGKAPVQPGKFH